MTQNKKPGQILLITMLVLSIIGIVVVGVIVLARRDILQVGESKKYEQAYNASETRLGSIIEKYGRYEQVLSTIITDYNVCVATTPNIKYDCTFQDNTYTNGTYALKTKVTVENIKDIKGWQIYKDRSFQISLNGYRDIVQFKWSKAAGVDISLIYKDAAGTIKVIKDLFDPSATFTSMLGDNPYNDLTNIHAFNYTVFDATNTQTSMQFKIDNTAGLLATDTPLNLSITPRLKTSLDSVTFDITAVDKTTFPYQLREFTASSFDAADPNTPVAAVTTKLPMVPQIDNLFDYALLTDDALQVKVNPKTCSIYNVTKFTDTDDGVCDADCSLREAISYANANACPTDKILLSTGTYVISRIDTTNNLNTYDDTNSKGDFDIKVPITIQGIGSGSTVIDARGNQGLNPSYPGDKSKDTGSDRVFDIVSGGKLTIDGVTVTGGRIADSGEGVRVQTGGELVMSNSGISGNAGAFKSGYGSYPSVKGGYYYGPQPGSGGIGAGGLATGYDYNGNFLAPAHNGSGFGGANGTYLGGGGGGNIGGGGSGAQTDPVQGGGAGGGSGGGLIIYGKATLSNVSVMNNVGSTGANLQGDTGGGGGGGGSVGIMVYGTLNLSNSVVGGNTAGSGAKEYPCVSTPCNSNGWGGGGGGVGIFVNTGAVAVITSTTIQYNFYGSGGPTIISNNGYGYGIYNMGSTTLTNVQINNPSYLYVYYPGWDDPGTYNSYGVYNAGSIIKTGSTIFPNCTGCP